MGDGSPRSSSHPACRRQMLICIVRSPTRSMWRSRLSTPERMAWHVPRRGRRKAHTKEYGTTPEASADVTSQRVRTRVMASSNRLSPSMQPAATAFVGGACWQVWPACSWIGGMSVRSE